MAEKPPVLSTKPTETTTTTTAKTSAGSTIAKDSAVVATTTAATTATTTTATTNTTDSNTDTTEINADAISKQELLFLDGLIDDVIFCECLQVHRAAKMGLIFTEPGDEMYKIKDGNGLDVFGQSLARPKKQMNCTCPQCGRNIAASRLAPHLEKCMGMGRLSARAASNKRDTNNTTN